jgi:hypothetical protein
MKTVTFAHDFDLVLERDEGGRPTKVAAYYAGQTYEKVPAEVAKAAEEAKAVKPD